MLLKKVWLAGAKTKRLRCLCSARVPLQLRLTSVEDTADEVQRNGKKMQKEQKECKKSKKKCLSSWELNPGLLRLLE
jgi:hypothetical protein